MILSPESHYSQHTCSSKALNSDGMIQRQVAQHYLKGFTRFVQSYTNEKVKYQNVQKIKSYSK